MKQLLTRLFHWSTDEAYEQGWQDGVLAGIKAARVMLYQDLRNIGSTGDYLEVPWADVDELFGAEEN